MKTVGTALGQKNYWPCGRQEQLYLPEFLAAIADRIRRNLQDQGRQLLEKSK